MNFSTSAHRVTKIELSEIQTLTSSSTGREFFTRSLTVRTDKGDMELTLFADKDGNLSVEV